MVRGRGGGRSAVVRVLEQKGRGCVASWGVGLLLWWELGYFALVEP